jgi:hypothetical protein
LSVRNIGNEAANYFGHNQKLIDASGRECAAYNMADMRM